MDVMEKESRGERGEKKDRECGQGEKEDIKERERKD
jgi:hypothetical protein